MQYYFALCLRMVKAIYSFPRRLIGVEQRGRCRREPETEIPPAIFHLSPALGLPFCLCLEVSLRMYKNHPVQHFDIDYKLGALGRN